MRKLIVLAIFVGFVGAIVFRPESVTAAAGDTFLASLRSGTTTTQGTNHSFNGSMTPDGRYVAFASTATNLVPSVTTYTASTSNVFVRDRQTNTTELISVSNTSASTAGNGSSNNPTISDDGCRVAFASNALNLAPEGGIGFGFTAFVRERCTSPVTRLVSKNQNPSGSPPLRAPCNGFDPSISANGQYVAYYANESFGGCLIDTPAYPAGNGEIFAYDWNLDASKRVSLKNGGILAATNGNQPSSATISSNGCRIAFISMEDIVTPTPTQAQVMVRDRCASPPQTFVVSRAEGAGGVIPTDNGGSSPMISADGNFVTWVSNSQQLATNTLTNNQTVTYTVNAPVGSNTPVFTSSNSFACTVGVQCFFYANAVSTDVVDSVTCTAGSCATFFDQSTIGWRLDSNPTPAGSFSVTFHADDGNAAGGQTVNQVATVNNLAAPVNGLPNFTNATSAILTQGTQGAFAVNVSSSAFAVNITCGPSLGTQVPATSGNCGGALPAGMTQQISGTCNCNGIITGTPTSAGTSNVVYKVSLNVSNIWVRDIAGNHTTQANLTSAGAQSSATNAGNPSISADGRYVMFQAAAPDLPNGNATRNDVWLRDRTAATTEMASVGTGGVIPSAAAPFPASSIFDSTNNNLANNWTSRAGISTNGQFVVFTSNAANLAPVGLADANAKEDVFVHERTQAGGGGGHTRGDYDNDHKTDIAVWRPGATSTFFVMKSGGGSIQQNWGTTGDIPVPGDYDGDGKTDIAVWRPGAIGTFFISLSGGGSLQVNWGTTGDIPAQGDYDGDGKTDIAVWRPGATGVFYVQLSGGGAAQQNWGTTGDIPTPGDYDGDGKTDYSVWRPAVTGTWFVMKSGGGSIQQPWGTIGDIPTSADYDHDGKDDISVWRPAATGTWFVMKSGGGGIQQPWGTTGDTPVPGDYDNDGLADIAVWRAGATGTWFVMKSGGGSIQQPWGTTGDQAISK